MEEKFVDALDRTTSDRMIRAMRRGCVATDRVEPGALTSRPWWKSYRVSEAITTSTISNAITRGKESASKR